ncbi:MAG: hypothetical protein ACI83O_000504 [Patescibacteria group bacterium]|jgi:hypothetical protein
MSPNRTTEECETRETLQSAFSLIQISPKSQRLYEELYHTISQGLREEGKIVIDPFSYRKTVKTGDFHLEEWVGFSRKTTSLTTNLNDLEHTIEIKADKFILEKPYNIIHFTYNQETEHYNTISQVKMPNARWHFSYQGDSESTVTTQLLKRV